MTEAKPDPSRLLDEAIDLVIRLQNDPENPVALDMIKSWRARSSEHEQVWTKVSGAHGMSGKILKDRAKAERREKSKLTRRKFIVGGAAGAGAIATGALLIPDAIVRARADYLTEKGEIRRVQLSDGSFATLGPESAIALDYQAERRGIELLKGMSFFEVAKEAGRPFVVETGRLTATAVGTAFDISEDAGFVSVSVAGGLVETRSLDGASAAAAQLAGGDWMTFDPSSHGVDRGRREPGQIAAWRDALLVADREPVSALVARIRRWYPGNVVIADPYIGAQRVSGIFDLRTPLRALEAVVHPAGGRVRELSSFLTVISSV